MPRDTSRIVISGAGGYIGTALAQRLAGDGASLSLVSRSHHANKSGEHVVADLTQDGVWDTFIANAFAVIHLSARTELRAAESDAVEDERLNVLPLRNLIASAKRRGGDPLTILFASTVTIVGDKTPLPVNERTPDNPITVYDRHKLVCEKLLRQATEEGALRACSLRLANVYGGGASKNKGRGIVNQMLRRAAGGEPLTIFGDGGYVRDHIHLDDVVNAFCCALAAPPTQDGRHFVVASGDGRKLVDVFNLIAVEASRLRRAPVEVRHVPEPADLHRIERRNFIGDSRAFSEITNWTSRIPLEEGIRNDLRRLVQLSAHGAAE